MADSTLADVRPPTAARISLDTVRQAAESLIKWKSTKSLSENPNLLADEEEYLYLNLTLKKIPPKTRVNPYKIPLPHPLRIASDTELCLIIDDREKSKLTKAEAKKKVEAEDIGVGKILKLSKLRTDYVAFEAKRKLCDSYDMFLVDKQLVTLLRKLLGKQFYKKKKIPAAIDLSHKNWKEQINRAIGSGLFYLRTGTCSVVKVARVSMESEEIVENVMAAVNGIVETVPKKWDGVRSFHLKLSESLSLPIYQALPDLKLKIDGVEKFEEEVVDEGEEADDDGKKDENATKKKPSKKGKIPEVMKLDDKRNDLAGERKLESEDDPENGTVFDEDNVESEDAPDVDEVPIEKRKKAAGKLEKALSDKKKKSKRNVDEKKVVKKENIEDAKVKVSVTKGATKKLKTDRKNLKDKKMSRVAN